MKIILTECFFVKRDVTKEFETVHTSMCRVTQPIICYFYSIVVTYVNRAHVRLGKGKGSFFASYIVPLKKIGFKFKTYTKMSRNDFRFE